MEFHHTSLIGQLLKDTVLPKEKARAVLLNLSIASDERRAYETSMGSDDANEAWTSRCHTAAYYDRKADIYCMIRPYVTDTVKGTRIERKRVAAETKYESLLKEL